MTQEFDVVCLGGGVAGEAIAGRPFGTAGCCSRWSIRELVGGECPYWGCEPSKTLLRSGETLSEADRARLLAASRVDWTVDFSKVSKRVLWMARDFDDSRPAAAMEATGAKLFRGEGRLADLRTVEVGSERLIARRATSLTHGPTDTRPAETRRAAPISRSPPSMIRTATAGCFKRSRRGFPDEDSAGSTSRR